ncbi:conserved hypothetical protein [Vibrio chagasii]|nr:conserved hypothetical protein [Vibrio chagasii]
MSFRTLSLPISLATGYQDPNSDFFAPVLSHSKQFDVAVGYFTSGWLKDVIDGVHQLALKGGRCRFVVSPQLDPKDVEAILNTQANELNGNGLNGIEQRLFEQLCSVEPDKRELLSNLISAGVCEFKVAIPKRDSANLFHAKIGVAVDKTGEAIAFNGSFNFTANAKNNWEYIDIYRQDSSRDNQRIDAIRERFDCLWNGHDVFYQVSKPSEALVKNIGKYSTVHQKLYPIRESEPNITLRPYQEQAIEAWGQNRGKGMFVMATGSGKTITALSAVKRVVDKFNKQKRPIVVVFVLPLKHLLDQWHEEAQMFGFIAIKCYETSSVWREQLAEKLAHQALHQSGVVTAMVTNATLSSSHFQRVINGISTPLMLVADEAHNLGSSTYLNSLPQNAEIRLGLTATPDRFNDEKGTKALINYFDKVVFEFSLEDAINAGFLVNYNYHPFICEFNHEEFYEYKAIVSRLESEQTTLVEAEAELDLITSGASNKLVILRKELEKLLSQNLLKHTLVYCGSHRDDEGSRQIEKVLKILGTELGVKARKFTAEESVTDRHEILEQFSATDLEAIVAIKCLDEGVDVPATKQAFVLASTSNPREFIQRRGRVLRRSIGKEEANIYDFIMVPPPGEVNTHLVSKEVKRGLEYNSLAKNAQDNHAKFDDLMFIHDVELDE